MNSKGGRHLLPATALFQPRTPGGEGTLASSSPQQHSAPATMENSEFTACVLDGKAPGPLGPRGGVSMHTWVRSQTPLWILPLQNRDHTDQISQGSSEDSRKDGYREGTLRLPGHGQLTIDGGCATRQPHGYSFLGQLLPVHWSPPSFIHPPTRLPQHTHTHTKPCPLTPALC